MEIFNTDLQHVEIGVAFGLICIIEICINAMVLYSICAGRLWKGRGSPIYIIAASNLAVDIIQLLIHAIYLMPCITANKFIFIGGRHGFGNVFFSSVFMFCWYHTSLNQTITALNRVMVICFSCRSFNTTRVVILCSLVYPISLVLTLLAQHFFPCCKFSFDHTIYSYSYTTIGDTPNWSNMMDIPLNNTSSLICVISYSWIIINMRKSRRNLSTAMAPAVSLRRKYKEYRYAMQFCAISVFYLLAWVCFRVFPVWFGESSKEWFSFIALCVIVNSGANGFTYLCNNQEVQRELRNTFTKFVLTDSSYHSRTLQNLSNSDIVRKQHLLLSNNKLRSSKTSTTSELEMSRPIKHSYRHFYEEKDGIVNQGTASATVPTTDLTTSKSAPSQAAQGQMDRRQRLPGFSPFTNFGRNTFFDEDFDRVAVRPYWADTSMFSGHRLGEGVNEIVDNEVEFKFTIDVSQFEPDELKVNIIDNDLVIEAKHDEKDDKFGTIARSFVRKFRLPTTVRAEEVKSELSRDGHLTVRYEKERSAGIKKVPIQIQKA
ncbi:unnamed protein product, partial [Mesorhabditis belari]|uniref:SHSP domain-containing protein n=1 Tax=Mesorhabditis belari TaxID=2138241 RepID=A0AAF3ELN1_9BILA